MGKDITLMEEVTENPDNSATPENNVHQGFNMAFFRRMRFMKQTDLAPRLGITQQALSEHEQKRIVNPQILQQAAVFLNVPLDLLQNMPEPNTSTIEIHDNTFEEGSSLNTANRDLAPNANNSFGNGSNYDGETFNLYNHPVDQFAEHIKAKEQADKDEIDRLKQELQELKELVAKLTKGK